MKKYLNIALAYSIAAMAGGIFYREFTKWNGYIGVTALGKIHTHLFIFGMLLFLIVALFATQNNLEDLKTFRVFMILYNFGLVLTVVMMLIRGIPQVLEIPLSNGADVAISVIAGIGHISIGTGLILLLASLKKLIEVDSMQKKDCPYFHVKKKTLLAIAGCVWIAAGFNVARLGILSYLQLVWVTWIHIFLSAVVFTVFGLMFFRMSMKHTARIHGYLQDTKPVWHFFDLKSYCIMAVMMGGGIWLRSSGLVPAQFIAVFYTGLGCALAMAGIFFWIKYFAYHEALES